ncbi:MAG: hypothetical protein FWC64_04825 [Treponema sp.]|nr:hypothetical protein [Treponema sp.]
MDDETKRAVYVAITRAKQNLHIFYNGNYFDRITVENIHRAIDEDNYPDPEQISLQLSHRDVFLGYFTHRKKEIESLVSGMELLVQDTGCFHEGKKILKFSLNFRSKKIEELRAKGYFPARATARYIVFWQDNDREEEMEIVLPCIEFSKKQ